MLKHDVLKTKLADIGYDGSHPSDDKIVKTLLALSVTLDDAGLTEVEESVVTDLLVESSQDKLKGLPEMGEGRWEDFNYGNVGLGNFVRVKKDAYDSTTGIPHNGLVGILSYMSHGRCLVNYVGLSSGKSMYHPMGNLESLKMM